MNLVPMVIETTRNGERAMDIASRLMKDRIIMLNGEVNSYSAGIICSQLLFLESEDPTKDINFFINSPGGSVYDGLSIYDVMNYIKCDVSTHVMGMAASMGSFLAAAGTKGKRFMLPSSIHMIHQPLGGARGQASDILIQATEITRIKDYITKVYCEKTGQDINQITFDMDRDKYMTAEAAISYGLADFITVSR